MVPAEQINKPREQGLKQREASQFCENLDMHNKKKSSQWIIGFLLLKVFYSTL